MKKFYGFVFFVLLFANFAQAQQQQQRTAEITVSLNERFFDVLLDAVFTNLKAPSFPIASNSPKSKIQSPKSESSILQSNGDNELNGFLKSSFAANEIANRKSQTANSPLCDETIRLQREIDGVRTAVRFRDGKIYAPIAFAGSYNPPFVGCVDFQGYAETNVELVFDKSKQMLIGRAQVLNVVLSGTNGVGSAFITKLVQGAVDKKFNPLQILQTDKLSFVIPIQNADGALRMRATGVRTEITNGVLNVYIAYEFVKV